MTRRNGKLAHITRREGSFVVWRIEKTDKLPAKFPTELLLLIIGIPGYFQPVVYSRKSGFIQLAVYRFYRLAAPAIAAKGARLFVLALKEPNLFNKSGDTDRVAIVGQMLVSITFDTHLTGPLHS